MTAALLTRLSRFEGGDSRGQAGSAIVEFVFLAVLMMVPVFFLVMVLARLQSGAYAVSAASREAGRAYVTAQVADQAPARAHSAAALAFADQGFASERTIVIGCDGTPCLRPEGRVRVTATLLVPMPLVPAFFAGIVPMQIPVSATHVATVDRFGASSGNSAGGGRAVSGGRAVDGRDAVSGGRAVRGGNAQAQAEPPR